MATKKVRKFASGGDILTALGAGLAGYGAYKYFTKDKDKDKEAQSSRNEGSGETTNKPKISEEVEKAQKGAAKEKPTNESSYAPDSKVGPKDIGFTGDGADTKPKPKPRPIVRKTPLASGPTSKADDVIGAGVRNAQIGRTAPAPDKTKPVEKKSPSFLSDKAGLSSKGITTPGDLNKKGDTSKGRSANPISGTFEGAGKSVARTPQQKMSEGAREVQRRREEEMKSRYKTGGSVSSASKRADGCAVRGKTRGKVY